MEINRKNYEIWFIDWLDGNLSPLQVEHLNLFLNENPDLKEELNELSRDSGLSISAAESFLYKEQLKKSPADITISQFEYLCVAYLEDDLSVNQQTEMREIINPDPDKKRTFELIQKTRLSPPGIIYKHKNLLLKRTAGQKVIRLSVIVLSAAAVLALIILNYFIMPHAPTKTLSNQAQNIVIDSTLHNPSPEIISGKVITVNNSVPAKQKKAIRVPGIKKVNPFKNKSELIAALPVEPLTRNISDPVLMPEKISVNSSVNTSDVITDNKLVASDIKFKVPAIEDTRSNIGRFIAKTFREKIMKEKTTLDSPLRGYEIAEAGITGLNKLLGWEMALKENNDESGNLKSVYFSSKLLKFNAPVKKSEPLP